MLFLSDARANIAPLFALVLMPMALMTGSAVDYGRAAVAQGRLQAALDAAVLAGAQASSRQTTTAQTYFASNHADAGTAVTPTFTLGPDGSVNGTASLDLPTTFMALAGISNITIGATAVAKASAPASSVCILLVEPTGPQALLVNSGAKLNAPNCEVHVRTTSSTPAIFNSGITFVTKRTCLAGSNPIYNSVSVANVEPRCAAASDPFAGTLPAPPSTACTMSNGNYNGGTVNLTPGVYCGWFNFNNSPTVKFAPGVYVIKQGGWNVNGGSFTGEGVTFYFADNSKIQFNSGIAAKLSAPTTGPYADILMYEAAGLGRSNFVFNDSVANELRGLIWLPSRDVIFNAASGLATDKATLVFNTLILNQTNWNLDKATTKTIPVPGAAGGSVYLSH